MRRGSAKRCSRLSLSALVLLGAAHCVDRPNAPPPDTSGVERVLEEIISADNRGDVEAIARLYAADAMLIPPGGPPVAGREAILRRYRQGFSQFSMEVSFQPAETVVAGDWAYNMGRTSGTLSWRDDRPPTPLNDDYLMVLRRSPDGNWQIFRLIWNSAGE